MTSQFSIGGKHWLAANLHVNCRAAAVHGAIYKVVDRLASIESRPNKPPLLRFGFKVESVIPTQRTDSIRRIRTKRILGQQREFVVRTDFPQPIGSGCGIVGELRFAFPQCFLGAFAFCYVCRSADELDELSVPIENRVP